MDLRDKRFLVIGGAGLIGSHVVDELIKTDAREIVIYDNFFRGSFDNLKQALADPRVKISPHGGDILHRDILEKAMEGMDGVFHLAAVWLLQCHEYPETAFEVNVRGTFNVIMAAIKQKVKRLVFSSSASPSTTLALASVPPSRNWPKCCSRSPVARSRSNMHPAAWPPSC